MKAGYLQKVVCCAAMDVDSYLTWAMFLASSGSDNTCVCDGVGAAAGPVATELLDALTGVQQEKVQDSFGWVVPVL